MALLPFFCGKDCGGDACPLLAEVEDGHIRGMHLNPLAGRYIKPCGKGFRAHKNHASPRRLKTPLLRTGRRGSGQFREIGWDEALSYIVQRLIDIRAKDGPGSVLCIASSGSTGALHNSETLARRFFNSIGGCVNVKGNYSCNAATYALSRLLGASRMNSGFDAETIRYSNLIVLWGSNPFEARLGAELPAYLIEAKKRGARIIAIDPRRSISARILNAEWIGIIPGTDAVLGYALLFEMLQDARFDAEFISKYSIGFESLTDYVLGKIDGIPKTPLWASSICGVDANVIIRLASFFWDEKPAMIIPGYSIQRVAYGEEAFRLTMAIQLATRNSGLLGASTGSINNCLPGIKVGTLKELPSSLTKGAFIKEGFTKEAHLWEDNHKSQGIEAELFTKTVPILRWADAVLSPSSYGLGSIKALYSAGGNFLNQGANVTKNIKAFESVEFAVCHELFLTPSARYCDIVLPVSDGFEKEDIGIPWAGNYVLYKPEICRAFPGTHSDYWIFSQLSERFGLGSVFTEGRTESQWIEQFLAESEIADIEAFRIEGIFLKKGLLRGGLDDFIADPVHCPIGTNSGKIEFASPLWNQNMTLHWQGLMKNGSTEESFREFRLLTPKVSNFIHSQRIGQEDRSECAQIHINPKDMSAIGAQDGEILKVWNKNGTLMASALADDWVQPGTVWIEEGIWTMPIDEVDLCGNPNMLTSDEGTLESISNIMHGIPICIGRIPEATIGH